MLFFNDTATTEIYTLSLPDALPISISTCGAVAVKLDAPRRREQTNAPSARCDTASSTVPVSIRPWRSEEHTSELQSRQYLVCRLLLEKKKIPIQTSHHRSIIHSVLI